MNDFISELKNEKMLDTPEEPLLKTIWNCYERVVIESLFSTFSLGFIISAQHGGDVDTIHNVRQIGIDENMKYKNVNNQEKYDTRGEYSHKNLEGTNYQQIKHDAREAYRERGQTVADAYQNKQLLFLGKSKNRVTELNAELDHVIAAKKIHDDPGRLLAGLNSLDLADDKTNLAWTNEHLNASMKETEIPDYISKHPELDEETKARMMAVYNNAKQKYEKTIIQKYYFDLSNPQCQQFYKDASFAAAKLGVKMGLSEALGFVFAEVWVVTKNELLELPPGCDFIQIMKTVGIGIKKGFESALSKYKEILNKFCEGMLAGVLSSLATTLCNVFFTTPAFYVKNIRIITSSVTRSTRILLFNPDDLELGDRIKVSSISLAMGASSLAGAAVATEVLAVVGVIPLGDKIARFCSLLVSGLLSCTLLLFADRSGFINDLVDLLNQLPTETTDLKNVSEYLESYAAKLNEIDLEQFKKDTEQFQEAAESIVNAKDDIELNKVLMGIYKHFDLPWQGDFDDFMSDSNNILVFE